MNAASTNALTRDSLISRFGPRALNLVLASAVVVTVLAAPAPAMAKRLGSDAVAAVPLAAGRVAPAQAPDIDAAAGIVVTADGRELWGRNAHTPRPMASTTKLMTALLSLEQGNLDKPVFISWTAAQTPYGIGLQAGSMMPKRKLLELALVASSNDAAYALGEDAGPGMPAFVAKMNAKAAALGLSDTHFVNPHGLDAPGHYSSPADLARLLVADLRYPEFRRAISMKTVSAPGIGSLSSTDKLLRVYPGLEGGKTGTTSDAGACFVATAKRNGVSLVSVVLGADGGDARFVQTTRLFDWGFRHTGRRVLAHAGDRAGSVAVKGATGAIPVRIASSVPSLFFDLAGPVRSHLEVGRPTQLPVFAGERLADVVFTQGGRVVGRAPAVSIASVASVAATAAPVPVADIPGRFVATRYVPVTTVAAFDPAGKLQRRMVVPSEIGTPVKRGQRLGQVVYTQGSRVVATVPIVAAEDVARPDAAASFRIALLRGWRALVLALIESPRV